MSHRCFAAGRALLAAALLSTLASSPASAAAMRMYAFGNEIYLCQSRTWTRDGASTPSGYFDVVSAYANEFDLGLLPPGPNGDSPNFDRVDLQCWVRDRLTLGYKPKTGERSYSIRLPRNDAFWERHDPDELDPVRSLPRDGTVITLFLHAVGDAASPAHLEIRRAFAVSPASDDPKLSGDYDLVHVPRLMPD